MTEATPERGFWSFFDDVRQTCDVTELNVALSKLHAKAAAIKAHVTGQEGNRTFKYADLPSFLAEINPMLAELGLCMQQLTTGSCLITRLGHNSGQWIMVKTDIHAALGDRYSMPDLLKAMTRARRMAAFAILNISGQDDEKAEPPGRSQTQATPPPPPPNVPKEDQRFLGDAEQGQGAFWFHSARVVADGTNDKGKWQLWEAATTTGERFVTFSDGDAKLVNDMANAGVCCMVAWKHEVRNNRERYTLTKLSPMDANVTEPAWGSVTITATEAKKMKDGRVIAQTNRGAFGVRPGPAAEIVETAAGSGVEFRALVNATKAVRLITEVVEETEEPAADVPPAAEDWTP